MDVTLYHNPNCSKSRRALEILAEAGIQPMVVAYETTGWTAGLLTDLAAHAGLPLSAFLRAGEPVAIDLGLADDGVSDDDLLAAMIAHPLLVERPIAASAKGVVIARPPERVLEVV